MYGIQKNGIDEPICREGMETQMQRMDLWTQGGGEERMEKVAFTKHCKNLKNKQKINLKRSQWSEVAKSIV